MCGREAIGFSRRGSIAPWSVDISWCGEVLAHCHHTSAGIECVAERAM